MDTVAHGLWSYLIFSKNRRCFWALVIGMLPDIVAFVPHFFVEHFSGGQAIFDALYRVTHSLVIFMVVFCFIAFVIRSVPWVASAWGIHIVVDIFTHPQSYYPTPYLYPFDSPFWFALDYRSSWFYAINYATLLGVFLTLFIIDRYYNRRQQNGR